MIYQVVGKPRAGKGRLVCGDQWEHSIYQQLTKTNRYVIHNMKLYVGTRGRNCSILAASTFTCGTGFFS